MNSRIERLEIDLADVSCDEQLHTLLMQRLEFPNYYGKNWDAFWDVITEPGRLPHRLVFHKWPELQRRLPTAAQQLRDCLEQAKCRYPFVDCNVEYAT